MKDAILKAMLKDLIAAFGSHNVTKKTFYKRTVQASNSYRHDINKRAILSDKIVLLRFGNRNIAFATYIVGDDLYTSVSIKDNDKVVHSSAPLKQELLVSEIYRFINQDLKATELIDTIIKAFISCDFALLSDLNRCEIKKLTDQHCELLNETDSKMKLIFHDIKCIFDKTVETITTSSINEAEYGRIYSNLDELKEVERLQAELSVAQAKLNAKTAKIRSDLAVLTDNEKCKLKEKISSKTIVALALSLPDLSKATTIEQAYVIPEIKTLLRNILKLKFETEYRVHRVCVASYAIKDAISECNLQTFIDPQKDILYGRLQYC